MNDEYEAVMTLHLEMQSTMYELDWQDEQDSTHGE